MSFILSDCSDIVSVKDFGAVGNGIVNDTAAIQAAINYVSAVSGGMIYIPAGSYRITDTLRVADHRVTLMGDSVYRTNFIFEPPAPNMSAIEYNANGVPIVQCGLMNISFVSADLVQQKTAISLVDVSQFIMENVQVNFPWTGNNSIGLRVFGRDLSKLSRLTIAADIPIWFSANPNHPVIDCDQFHFCDMYLIGDTAHIQPIVLADSGIHLTNLTFDGFQAWAHGGAGFLYNDVATAQYSYNLVFKNIRWEQQPPLTAGYMIRIVNAFAQSHILIENCHTESGQGFYFRGCAFVTLLNCAYWGAQEALNADATCCNLVWTNCDWRNISAMNLAGLFKSCSFDINGDSGGAHPANATYTRVGGQLGFYTTAAALRQVLATGAGHVVDDVITALQNLGLVQQA